MSRLRLSPKEKYRVQRIKVDVAAYLAPLDVKTSATVVVDMDGMDEDWVVMQNSTSIADFTKKNGKLYINVYRSFNIKVRITLRKFIERPPRNNSLHQGQVSMG